MPFEATDIYNDLLPVIAVFFIEAGHDFVLGYGRTISVVNNKKESLDVFILLNLYGKYLVHSRQK